MTSAQSNLYEELADARLDDVLAVAAQVIADQGRDPTLHVSQLEAIRKARRLVRAARRILWEAQV